MPPPSCALFGPGDPIPRGNFFCWGGGSRPSSPGHFWPQGISSPRALQQGAMGEAHGRRWLTWLHPVARAGIDGTRQET